MNLSGLSEYWISLSRRTRRLLIALALSIDAWIGLLYQFGLLNIIDILLFNHLPTDLVWLLQTFQLICVGFFLMKILFDDVPDSWVRTILIGFSPILFVFHILFSLHILFLGQGLVDSIDFNLFAIIRSTLNWSSTYLAIAIGCTLTYSVQRYGNFSQSEFFMLGSYVAIALMWTDWLFPLHDAAPDGTLVWSLFLYALVGAFILSGLAGVIIDRLIFKGFRDKKSSSDIMMIASLGVAMILRGLVYLRFQGNQKRFVPDADWVSSDQGWDIPNVVMNITLGNLALPTFDYGTYNYAYSNAFLPIVVFSIVFLLYLLLTQTRLGHRMRAVADNPELAASSGINVERVQLTSAFLSAGISGAGGAVFGMTVLFYPITAFTLLLPAFAVIILGTIGSVSGAIGASLIIGFVRAISEPMLSGIGTPLERGGYLSLAAVAPYASIIAILLIMPEGIGKAYEEWNIERLRKRAKSKNKPDKRVSCLMGILFGWAGGHHFHQGRSAKGVSMLTLTVLSFGIGKATSFIRTNSFYGKTVNSAPEYLDASLHSDWISLIHTEQTVIGIFGLIGDILWPFLPIAIYIFALYESYLIWNNNYRDILLKPKTIIVDKLDEFSARLSNISISITDYVNSLFVGTNKSLDSFNESASSFVSNRIEKVKNLPSLFYKRIGAEYGRESEVGSKAAFWIFFTMLLLVVIWLPTVSIFTKTLQVSNIIVTISIFLLLAYSLNLHTGMTGLLNFGVIFFASVGAITVGILTGPSDGSGYEWPIIPALIVAMLLGAIFGWLLAYPTARLRSDYFAIITISLGEIVRLLLMSEPLLMVGGQENAVGINRYELPLQEWWLCGSDPPLSDTGTKLSPYECSITSGVDSIANTLGNILGLGEPAPYMMLLAIISLVAVALVWKSLNLLFNSPWGRILKSIREDEEVAQHHGHDIFTHKAASLAIGAAIAAFAGAIWAWKLNGFAPTFMSPSRSTFLVWAAFIIGGAGNNRGMLIGAMIIALVDFVFNVLIAAQGSSSLPLAGTAKSIDALFVWLVADPLQPAVILMIFALLGMILRWWNLAEISFWFSIVFIICGFLFDQRSLDEVYPVFLGGIKSNMSYLKIVLVGFVILISLKLNPKGLLPEVPYRPERPEEVKQDD